MIKQFKKIFLTKDKLITQRYLYIIFAIFILLTTFFFNFIVEEISKEPIVCGVIVFIVFVCFGILGWVFHDYEKIRNQIKSFSKEFDDIRDNKKLTHNFETLNQKISHYGYISDIWDEFSETLINYRDPNRQTNPQGLITAKLNTVQIEEFINNESIIYRQTHIILFEAIPGILTGLGLVGTFLAILFALKDFNTDPNLIQSSVATLLTGISFKFMSSLAGILTAIIFTIVKKTLIANLEDLIHKIQTKINKIFTRKTSEALLNDMLYQIEQQTKDLKEFLTEMDFSQHIKKALDSSFEADFKPIVSEVIGVIDHSNEIAVQNKHEIISKITESINETLNNQALILNQHNSDSVDKILDSFNPKLEKIDTDLISSKDSLNIIYYDYLKPQIDDLKTSLNNNLGSSISEAIKNSMQDITSSFSDAINEMKLAVGELKNLKQESSASLIETLISEMKNSVKDMLIAIQEAMLGGTDGAVKDLSKTLAETSNCLVGMQGTFDSLIIRLEEKFNHSEAQRDEALQTVISNILNKLSGFMEELNFKISDLVNVINSNDNERQIKLVESVEIISRSVESLLEEINTSGSRSKEQTEITINTIKDQTTSLQNNIADSLQTNLQQIVDKVNDLMTQINTTTSEVTNSTRYTVESISSSCNAVIENANKVMESQNYKLNEWSNLIKTYIDQVKTDQTDLQERFNRLLQDLNNALENQIASTKDSSNLVNMLKDASKEIYTVSSQLNSASENISQIIQKANDTNNNTNALFENFNKLNADFEDKLKQNITLWQVEKQAFNNIESTINNLIGNLAGRTETFVQQSKSVQEEFYKNITEKLASEVSGLNVIVQEQREIMEELSDILGNLRR